VPAPAPPPPPPPKPTGFRQPGQVLNAPANTGGRSVTNPGKLTTN
jgi:hypothetical protein